MNSVHRPSDSILIAVADPALQTEATHIAAATGLGVLATSTPGEVHRYLREARAVLIDAATVREVQAMGRREALFLVESDPGPIDWQLATRVRAAGGFVLPAQSLELLSELGALPAPGDPAASRGEGRTVAVLGSCGGAGTSTLAVALAGQARPATLVDACPQSGGLDLLLGAEEASGARWQDMSLSDGRVSGTELRAALPQDAAGTAVLTCARSTLADPLGVTVDQVTAALAALSGAPGITVVDTPGPSELREAVVEAADQWVLLVPTEVRAVAAAAQMLAQWRERNVHPLVVVRNRGWAGLETAEVEELLDAPVVAELGAVPRLPRLAETAGLAVGMPRALKRTAVRVLEALQ